MCFCLAIDSSMIVILNFDLSQFTLGCICDSAAVKTLSFISVTGLLYLLRLFLLVTTRGSNDKIKSKTKKL